MVASQLNQLGFKFTIFQILRPSVIYSKIKPMKFNGLEVEMHVRIYTDGKILCEFEPKRLRNVFSHLFTRSYSAHEQMISWLEEWNVKYHVDMGKRYQYNTYFPKGFPPSTKEFFVWLTSCILVFPFGFLVLSYRKIKHFANLGLIATKNILQASF